MPRSYHLPLFYDAINRDMRDSSLEQLVGRLEIGEVLRFKVYVP